MSRPIGIDLFAGAGGLSLGFEQAGFDIAAAVEIDPVHSAVHQYNFPNCVMVTRSVSELTGSEIRKVSGIGTKTVDVVFGGPPCQGFSLIGHRALDDPRNQLVGDFLRLVRELDAKYFVFENVKGLTVGRHRKFLDELISEVDGIGYELRLPWKVLDAADFGVPQHRERLILFGAKKGLPIPCYPNASSQPADFVSDSTLPTGPTCRDALDDLPNAESFPALFRGDEVEVEGWSPRTAYAREMRCTEDSGWHLGIKREWNRNFLTCSGRTDHSPISRVRFGRTEPGQVEPISRFFKLSQEGLSNTLRAGTDSARGAFTSPRPIHYRWSRCITVREMARLHGFPDWFRFHVTKWHGARQIGNAVPPPLGRAIASTVVRALGHKVFPVQKTVGLGEVRLLQMNMAEAARHFDIPAPIGRRDRKSGAKKRKQRAMNAAEAEACSKSAEFDFREMILV